MKASDFVASFGPKGPSAWENQAIAMASSPTTFYTGDFVPVTVSANGHTGTFFAAQEYASVGEGADFMRMPLSPVAAQRMADLYGLSLPTPKMVQAIWQASTKRPPPAPLPNVQALATYLQHSRAVDAQIGAIYGGVVEPGAIVAGHKKDVVLTNTLLAHPGNVAIYGWQNADGSVIQPLNSTSHADNYADYSHGIRLVLPTMIVDGAEMPLAQVFASPTLAPLVSSEGVLQFTRYPGAGTGAPPIASAPGEGQGFIPASFVSPTTTTTARPAVARSSGAAAALFALGGMLAVVFARVRKSRPTALS